jgi:hypothetical protein
MRGLRLALGIVGFALIAPLALHAVAQQADAWKPTPQRWTDGSQVEWRATEAPACYGSNVELRYTNASGNAGAARLTALTFACKNGGEFTSPDRALGVVMGGGQATSAPISCVCAEKGGVKDLRNFEIDFQREGMGEDIAANGCTYKGSYVGGKRTGQGSYACPNGQVLEGFFRNGSLNGPGTEKLATGQVYTGEFADGVRQGNGKITYVDGSSYEGVFRSGLRNGVGTLRYKDGSEYVGEWKDDRRMGRGTYVGADKSWIYDGEWLNDLRNGQGKLSYSDGSYVYEGPYRNDVREGVGTVTFADGRVFKGAFVNGEQLGPGSMTFPNGRQIVGDFRDHRPHGHAVDSTPDAVFDGQWVNGQLEGKATVLTIATGVRFEGQFAGGRRNGLGVETLSDGSKLECRFVNDVAQKPCNRVLANGRRIEYRN